MIERKIIQNLWFEIHFLHLHNYKLSHKIFKVRVFFFNYKKCNILFRLINKSVACIKETLTFYSNIFRYITTGL